MIKSKQSYLHLFLSLFAVCILTACEGGKNKGGCDPMAQNCPTVSQTKQCPTGTQLINETCRVTSTPCTDQTTPSKNCPLICPKGQKVSKGGDLCELECPPQQYFNEGACIDDDINIEILHKTACNDGDTGYINVAMQFIARDNNGFAIDPVVVNNKPTALLSQIYMDGAPPAAKEEAPTRYESKLLQSDMVLTLVLDNSLSMLGQASPMRAAAVSILEKTKEVWELNGSNFYWDIRWFNDELFKPAVNAAGKPWDIRDINQIPDPVGGTALYKAIHHMIDVHKNIYNEGIASGQRDQHIMIVLSDGEDTISHRNTPNFTQPIRNASDTLRWTKFGWYGVALDQTVEDSLNLINALQNAPPNLQVHVIGLGEDANNNNELETIATAGKGLYFDGKSEGSSNSVTDLFNRVQKEFITVQTVSLRVSPSNGTYEFTIHAEDAVLPLEGDSEESFTVTVGNLEDCN